MLDNKTKERIKLEAAFKADDGMAHWSPMKAYIAGAEAEATRAAGLVEVLTGAINELDDLFNPNLNKEEVADKITKLENSLRKALTNYNNQVNK